MKHLGYDDDGLHCEGLNMKTLNTNEDCRLNFIYLLILTTQLLSTIFRQ